MKASQKVNIFFSVIIIIFVVLLAMLLTSCVTEKKVKKYCIDKPEILNEICPKIDTTRKTITVIKIDTITTVTQDTSGQAEMIAFFQMIDSIQFAAVKDSILKKCGTVKIVYKTITKEIFRTDTFILSNDAALKLAENNGYNRGLIDGQKYKKTWYWIAGLGWLVCLLLILLIIGFFRFKKKV